MAGSPGYYVSDPGVPNAGEVKVFFMAAEPPDGQYRLDGDQWVEVPDGWYLSDRLIDGDPGLSGPFAEAPNGAPPPPVAG